MVAAAASKFSNENALGQLNELDVLQAIIRLKDPVRWTPLHCAAEEGHEAVVRLLVEVGANKKA